MTTDIQTIPTRVKWLLGLIFLSQTTSFVFTLIALLVSDIPGMDPTSTGITLAATMLLMSVIGPYAGRGLDLGHGLLWCFLAALFYAIGILGFVFNLEMQHYVIVPILIFYFVSLVIAQTLCSALIEGYIAPELRQRTATLLSMSGNLAMIVANLTAYFYFKANRELLLVADLATNILMFAYMAYCFKNLKIEPKARASAAPSQNPWGAVGKIFSTYPFLMLSCVLLLSAVYAQAYIFPIIFNANGVDAYKFTTAMGTLNGLIVVAVGVLITRNLALKTFNSKLITTCFFTGVGFFFMPFVSDLPSLLWPIVIWSIGEITIYPVTTQILYSIFPENEIGIAAASKGILARLAQVITPLIAIVIIKLPLLQQALLLSVPFVFTYVVIKKFAKNTPAVGK